MAPIRPHVPDSPMSSRDPAISSSQAPPQQPVRAAGRLPAIDSVRIDARHAQAA